MTAHDTIPDHAAGGASRRFQVLSLDGGGIRGIFTAALLAGIEEDVGYPVAERFDLIVGTSTGGVIALGLGAGLSPREILDFYLEERHRIFPARFGLSRARQLFAAKYSNRPLETALRGVLGDKVLADSRVPLVIPSYNLGENEVYLFKTPHHPRLRRDGRVPMWQVAMATAAAPTFFPAFRLPGAEVRLIDGGVWANNPAMVGVTEAVSMFGCELADIRVLSLGTMANGKTRRAKLDNGGILRWLRGPNVIDVLMNGQSAGAFSQVQHLVGRTNAHRLNPGAPEDLMKLDSGESRELVAKAAHHSRMFCPTVDEVFGSHTPRPYRSGATQTSAKAGAHARHD